MWPGLGTAVLVAAVVGVLWWHPWSGDGPDDAASTAAHPPLTQERADEISADLAAGDPAALQDAVALPADSTGLDPAAAPGLAGLGLSVDAATFAADGDVPDLATVEMTSTPAQGPATTWTATLAWIDGTWKITATGPAE
jgi:hypothetical protein